MVKPGAGSVVHVGGRRIGGIGAFSLDEKVELFGPGRPRGAATIRLLEFAVVNARRERALRAVSVPGFRGDGIRAEIDLSVDRRTGELIGNGNVRLGPHLGSGWDAEAALGFRRVDPDRSWFFPMSLPGSFEGHPCELTLRPRGSTVGYVEVKGKGDAQPWLGAQELVRILGAPTLHDGESAIWDHGFRRQGLARLATL